MKRKRLIMCLLGILLATGTSAHPGSGIVVDARGQVFYTDLAQVWCITPDGRRTIAVAGVHSHELSLDAAGNLYGEHLRFDGRTNQWYRRIWMRRPNGQVVDVVAERQGFDQWYGFQRDAQGNTYWRWTPHPNQATIVMRTAAGQVRTIHQFPRQLPMPANLARLPDGRFAYTRGTNLYRCVPGGAETLLAANVIAGSRLPWLVSTGTDVWIADYDGLRIQRVSASGQAQTIATSRAPWYPTGLAPQADGSLWLLETHTDNRVRVRHIRTGQPDRIFGATSG